MENKFLYVLVNLFAVALGIMGYYKSAMATPQSLTYQGRIIRSDGLPLSYGNVSFLFEIANPTGACVIYRELVEGVNMTNSLGIFDVSIGTGGRQFPTVSVYKLSDAFVNSVTHPCYGGATYTALADDVRVLKVQFFDGIAWRQISPSNVIRSVPFSHSAYSASKLGTLGAADFIQKTQVPGAPCAAGQVITFDGAKFSCVADGGSGGAITDILAGAGISVSGTNSKTVAVEFGVTAGTVTQGNDARLSDGRAPVGSAGGDLGGVYPNPQVVKIQATAVSATGPSAAGQVLRYNGTTQYAPAFLNIGDLRTSTSAPQFPSASCSAAQSLVYSSLTDQFSCADIAINANQVTSGVVTVANGGTGAASLAANSVLLGNGTGSLQAVAPGASGHVLTSNGTSWVSQPPSGGDATSWIEKSSNYTAVAGDHIFANTSAGAFTITLPASPSANDTIRIVDNSQSFSLNALTINPNGQRFSGGSSKNWIQNTQGRTLTLTYQNATYGWVVTDIGSITVPPAFNVWNVADKATALVLSNSFKDVTTSDGSSWNTVRALDSKDSGKWYFEFHLVTVKSGTPEAMFGVASVSATLNGAYLGSSAAGRGYQVQGGFTYGASYTGSKPAFAAGDVVGVAMDFTGNTLSIYKNGVYQGQFASMPVGAAFPAASLANDLVTKIRLVTEGTKQSYPPPAGFSAWE